MKENQKHDWYLYYELQVERLSKLMYFDLVGDLL